MRVSREDVMQQLLDAASDALKRWQPDEAVRCIDAYAVLAHLATHPGIPLGLDSGRALRDGAA